MPLQLPLDQVLPVLLSMSTHPACFPHALHFVQHTIAVDLSCLLFQLLRYRGIGFLHSMHQSVHFVMSTLLEAAEHSHSKFWKT